MRSNAVAQDSVQLRFGNLQGRRWFLLPVLYVLGKKLMLTSSLTGLAQLAACQGTEVAPVHHCWTLPAGAGLPHACWPLSHPVPASPQGSHALGHIDWSVLISGHPQATSICNE